MSAILEVSFLWGRYHATPWDRSANEGIVEWPPAPWRILRALYSAWKIHVPDLEAERVMSVLSALSEAPKYHVPPSSEAHTRHYMPGVKHVKGVDTDTDKQLDAFVVIGRDSSLTVEWAVDLSGDQRKVLAALSEGVRYLGRAESIVECQLVDEAGAGEVIAPENAEFEGGSTRLLVPDGAVSEETLTQTTQAVRSARRLMPAGTRLQVYSRPVVQRRTRPVRSVQPSSLSHAVRFSVGGSVQPSRFDAVGFGDLLHRAAVKRHGTPSTTLSGLDEAGVPLRGAHLHAHYLSMPERADLSGKRVGSILVWAPGGLTEGEVSALAGLVELRSNRLDGTISRPVVLMSEGPIEEVAPDLVGPSRCWISVTPYSPVHHHKGVLAAQLLQDVNLELGHRGLPNAVAVEQLPGPWLQYTRHRPGRERLQAQRRAYGLRLRFADVVNGPLVLGQLSHFGLGVFRPIPEHD